MNLASIWRKKKLFLWTVFIVALIIRLAYVIPIKEIPTSDAREYSNIAANFVEHKEYAHTPGNPTMYRAPGYPFFIALIYSLFGVKNYLAVRIIQALLGTLLCLITYFIAERIFGERVGKWAAVISVFYPFFIYYCGLLLTELLFTLLLAMAVLNLINLSSTLKLKYGVLSGIFLGFSALTRPIIVLFPILLFFWMLSIRVSLKKTLGLFIIMMFFMLLVISPWTVRNYLICHDFVPLGAEGGQTFYMGNNPLATGGGDMQYLPELDKLPEAERDRAYYKKGLEFIRQHPAGFFKLSLNKFIRFWRLYPHRIHTVELKHQTISLLSYGILLPFFLLGLFLGWKKNRKALLLFLLLIYFTIMHMIFVAQIRLRFPIEPYIIIFGALGINFVLMKFFKARLHEDEV